MSDTQPSTAYPTGVERNKQTPLSKPSDAGDHGHSKPVYLLPSSVRKPTAPERVVAQHRRCFEATTVSDHRSLASGAVGYASDLVSIPVCRKSVGFVALTSQYRQGTRRGSKQKKKSAVRRCRVQSEVVTIGRHLRVRPHHHAQTILPSSGWQKSGFRRKGRFPGARKQRIEGGVPASRVKQRVKLKKLSRSQFRIPMKCRPAETGTSKAKDREVVGVVFV